MEREGVGRRNDDGAHTWCVLEATVACDVDRGFGLVRLNVISTLCAGIQPDKVGKMVGMSRLQFSLKITEQPFLAGHTPRPPRRP
jgi:hypothetical protein